MLRKISFIIFLFAIASICFSQEVTEEYVTKKEYTDEILQIKRYNYLEKVRLNQQINHSEKFKSEISTLNSKIDSLTQLLIYANEANQRLNDSLNIAHQQMVQAKAETEADIREVNKTVTQRTGFWITGVGIMAILVFITLLVLWSRYRKVNVVFKEQFSSFQNDINTYLNKHSHELDKSLANLEKSLTTQNNNTKKLVLLNDFMKTLPLHQQGGSESKNTKTRKKGKPAEEKNEEGKLDHTLSIKMANELHEIKNVLTKIPGDTPDATVLKTKYEKVERILKEIGYEMVDLMGVPVTQELKKQADLKGPAGTGNGNVIVSKVILPQINYKGEIIQSAKLESKPA